MRVSRFAGWLSQPQVTQPGQQGDVVVSVNNNPVTPDATLAYLVSQVPIGQRVPLELIRGGQRRTVQVTIGERPTEDELARINNLTPEGPAVPQPGKSDEQTAGQRSTQ